MPKQKYFVRNRNFYSREHSRGNGRAIARDLTKQAEERVELLDRMRWRNGREPARINPLICLLFDLGGVALGTAFCIVVLKLIGVML